ncbi:3-methyl-2-oxobutanoate hydroxymethyltransferase [Brachybacterium sp. GPGPB12]|uniref:3-methyl-2-oxobutanoate hydroxymethyltransferase n=1 Tax=Brachybacterium sp. GPGPB12 TaxID=3023517 RepID=UPI0031342FF7
MSTESPAAVPAAPAKIRLRHLQQAKEQGRPFAMLTAYDQFSARVFEEAGIETLLIGDSVGTTVLGHSSTTATTHADMLVFTAAVARASPAR